MSKLPTFTLTHNENKHRWDLKSDRTDRVVKSFPRKADAVRGGALETAVGRSGGSVRIQKLDGKYQEERTYPRGADPERSRG